jgi:3-keto-disaccharide hydrolase
MIPDSQKARPALAAIGALALAIASLSAQAPPQPPQGRGQGRGGGGMRGAQPLNFEDRTGFQPIFDGTMKNWDGDPAIWKAEGNVLVGTTTEANPLKENTFVIWRGGEPGDFELKVEYRMSSTNSGIQFRSVHLPQGTQTNPSNPDAKIAGKWVLKGYQADIDFANQFTGMIYEERGRGFLMQRGQAIEIGPDGVSRQIGSLEMNADELKSLIKPGDWNTVHLIARGNTIINIVNGHVTAFIVDDDAKGRALKGLLGFQIHVGPPMKIEFRNIFLKSL